MLRSVVLATDGLRKLNVVVFRPKSFHNIDINSVLTRINDSGQVYVTPGKWQGEGAIRAAFCNWQTTMEDVGIVCSTLNNIFDTTDTNGN